MLKVGIFQWRINCQFVKRSDITMDKGSWQRKKGNKINIESKLLGFFEQNTILAAVTESIQLQYVYIRANKRY